MANPVQVAARVRFALSQIPAQNAHHTFETICRHVARQFICSNVLPATGPVSAGGDQGRDFETFRSHLRKELGPTGGFLGLVSEGTVAFVCTTQSEGVLAKIAGDVAKILESGHPAHEVKAFSLSSVPVGHRHKLESEVKEQYGIDLELFDAEALAELLATREGFWIGEHFLDLPAELRPAVLDEEEDLPSWYVESRGRWRGKRAPEPTLGDFIELKEGLREATARIETRPDFPFWLGLIREMLATPALPDPIRQRARYELVVGTLLGLDEMGSVDLVARAYLDDSLTEGEPARLQDAGALLLFVNGAAQRGLTAVSASELWNWNAALRKQIEHVMVDAPPNRGASLRFTLGFLGLQPQLPERELAGAAGEPPNSADSDADTARATPDEAKGALTPEFVDVHLAMAAWTELAEGLEDTPLFPVDLLSKTLQEVAPLLVDQHGWRRLVDMVDEAVARVSGDSAVAEQAHGRAKVLLTAGRRLEALAELHEAKIAWWSGDTIGSSLLAMLTIARLYLELRLPMPAKAHGLAVAYSALGSADEELAELVPAGLLMAAQADFASGAWCGATELFELGLSAQHQLVGDGLHLGHEYVAGAILDLTYVTACARDIDPDLAALVEEATARVGAREIIEDALADGPPTTSDMWDSYGSDKFTGPPFLDVGETRYIRFAALGTAWTLESANDAQSTRVAERFAVTAQTLLAELANEDLCLAPTRITVRVDHSASDQRSFDQRLEQLPSNDGRRWKVTLTSSVAASDLFADHIKTELLPALTSILLEASFLRSADFLAAIGRAFRRGLEYKLSPARPYDELAAVVTPQLYARMSRERFSAPWDCHGGAYGADPDLGWRGGPGPTYSTDVAKEMLRNRYKTFANSLRKTVPALRRSSEFRNTVRALRGEGWLDWHLLTAIANIVTNYRHALTADDLQRPGVRANLLRVLFEPEKESAREVPADLFTPSAMQQARQNAILSLVHHWDLEGHQRTPDFPGIERLLAARYGYWDDDVQHVDPFPEAR